MFGHQNVTSKGSNVTSRSTLPVLPQDDLSTSKRLQELYHEAYLLVKDVVKARKVNKNIFTSSNHGKLNPKDVFMHNRTSSSRQSQLLGQSPLPPFKTRQKNSTSFPVKNSSVTSTIYTGKISNISNSNRSENKVNGYFKISTVDQANYIQAALLGKKWTYNRTEPHGTSFRNRTKQFTTNITEWKDGKTQLFQNKTKDNDWPKNTSSTFNNNLMAKLKTHSYDRSSTNISAAASKLVLKTFDPKNESSERNGVNKFTHNQKDLENHSRVNKNSSRLQPSAHNGTNVTHNSDTSYTSNSSSRKYLVRV